MADQDEEEKNAPARRVPELAEALGRLPTPPDVSLLHAAIVEMLRGLGVPENLVEIEVLEFRRELTNETDRGAALFAAAHLDERLGAVLSAFLVADEAVAKPFFSGTGALATFSARIDMVYLVGLVPASVRRELHLVRKIRNDFAHSAKALHFNDATIASKCQALGLASFADEPRSQFIQATMSLAGIIDGKARLLAEGRHPRCASAQEIIPGDAETVRSALALLAESIDRVASNPAESKKDLN